MKNLFLVLLALTLTSCAHAATLSVSFTMPTVNNDAACGQTPVTTPGTDSVTAVLRILAGTTVVLTDSASTAARGALVSRTFTVAAGTYTVNATIKRVVSGKAYYSCPAVTSPIEAVAPPGAATFVP